MDSGNNLDRRCALTRPPPGQLGLLLRPGEGGGDQVELGQAGGEGSVGGEAEGGQGGGWGGGLGREGWGQGWAAT